MVESRYDEHQCLIEFLLIHISNHTHNYKSFPYYSDIILPKQDQMWKMLADLSITRKLHP